MPTHDGCGDLVGNKIAQNRGMTGAGSRSASNLVSDLANNFFLVQKRVVTLSLQPDQDAQVALVSDFQKPVWRGGVGSNGIHTVCRHLRKILFNNSRRTKRDAIYAWPTRSIGYAPDIEIFLAYQKKFPHQRSSRNPQI